MNRSVWRCYRVATTARAITAAITPTPTKHMMRFRVLHHFALSQVLSSLQRLLASPAVCRLSAACKSSSLSARGSAFSASAASWPGRGGNGRMAPRSQKNGKMKPRQKSKICRFPLLLNNVSRDSTKLGVRQALRRLLCRVLGPRCGLSSMWNSDKRSLVIGRGNSMLSHCFCFEYLRGRRGTGGTSDWSLSVPYFGWPEGRVSPV